MRHREGGARLAPATRDLVIELNWRPWRFAEIRVTAGNSAGV
jgi:hypothetical protein